MRIAGAITIPAHTSMSSPRTSPRRSDEREGGKRSAKQNARQTPDMAIVEQDDEQQDDHAGDDVRDLSFHVGGGVGAGFLELAARRRKDHDCAKNRETHHAEYQ